MSCREIMPRIEKEKPRIGENGPRYERGRGLIVGPFQRDRPPGPWYSSEKRFELFDPFPYQTPSRARKRGTMNRKDRASIPTLLLANIVAFFLIAGTGELRADGGGVDACNEARDESCDCICQQVPGWLPWGCYETELAEPDLRCTDWESCTAEGGGCNPD